MSCIAGERPTSGMLSASSPRPLSAFSGFFGSDKARPTMEISSFRSKGLGRYS
jgi:uracil DNA glycosylase